MKKYIRLMALVLALLMMFSLTACTKANHTAAPAQEANKEEKKEAVLKVVATSESYKPMFDKFTEKTGIKVEFLSMSSGELLSRMKAEGGKPMADIWFGGGLDAFMQAKEEGFLEAYVSPESSDIPAEYKDKDGFWIGKGITIVGFLVNNDVIKEKNLPMPKSWADLAKPEYKGEIIMSNPAVSGTNYAAVNGLLQMMGQDKGWKYFEGLNKNIPFYTKRGKDPELKTVAGEAAIGIIPVAKSSIDLQKEKNVTVIFPEDGIPWVPEGMAIFKNSDNLDGAKAFVDFALSKDIQQMLAELDGKDGAMLVKPRVSGVGFGVPKDKFIKQDLANFGKDRQPILDKWSQMTGDK